MFLSREFYGGSILLAAQDYNVINLSSTETFTTSATYTSQSVQIAVASITTTNFQPSQPSTADYYPALALVAILVFVVGFIALRMKRR
jgi:hypothetical protein